MPLEDSGRYHTIVGFMLFSFNRIPSTGDHFDCACLRFEAIDMAGNRIDKILVTPAPKHVSDTDQLG